LGLPTGRPPPLATSVLRHHPIMDDLLDMMDQTVAHPLHVHCDLAPQRQTISSFLRPHIPKDWCYHDKPLATDRPGCWRVDLRAHLLGQGRMGWLDKDCQMLAARLSALSALVPQRTRVAVGCVCFISAGEVVPAFVPTGCQLYAFAIWAHVAIVLFVVGK